MSDRTRYFVAPAAFGCGFVRILMPCVLFIRELSRQSSSVPRERCRKPSRFITASPGRGQDADVLICRHGPAVRNGYCRGREAAHRKPSMVLWVVVRLKCAESHRLVRKVEKWTSAAVDAFSSRCRGIPTACRAACRSPNSQRSPARLGGTMPQQGDDALNKGAGGQIAAVSRRSRWPCGSYRDHEIARNLLRDVIDAKSNGTLLFFLFFLVLSRNSSHIVLGRSPKHQRWIIVWKTRWCPAAKPMLGS